MMDNTQDIDKSQQTLDLLIGTRTLAEMPNLAHMELFALIRLLEHLMALNPKVGNETRLNQSPLRFGQTASLAFQDRQVHALWQKGNRLKIDIKGFGVFGSNGALPIHLTELTYEKNTHQKHSVFNDFVDLFHNRLIALFYKAWRNAQDIPSLDGNDQWQFSRYIASFLGLAEQKDHTVVPIYHQLYYSSLLVNRHAPSGNLQEILRSYFGMPIRIQENVGQWIDAIEFSTQLSQRKQNRLGKGLLIGDKIFDATQKFKVVIGAVTPPQYVGFLPKGVLAKQLMAWVEQYCRYQYQWDVEVVIDRHTICQQTLGRGIPLGITSWIGQPKTNPVVRCLST